MFLLENNLDKTSIHTMPCKFTVILYLLIKHGALTSTNRTTSLSNAIQLKNTWIYDGNPVMLEHIYAWAIET